MLLSVMNTPELINGDGFAKSTTTSPAKPEKSSLAEIKNGKALIRQKPVSFEKMSETMQETVNFRQMLEHRIRENLPALQNVPDDHLPLFAKLVHESDKTITGLAKHVHHLVRPVELGQAGDVAFHSEPSQDQLTLRSVETAILSIAERTNYGVDCVDKPPAALCIWRWEVKSQKRDWLPKSGRDAVEARIAERHEAKKSLLAIFNALPSNERESLLKGSKKDKGKSKLPEDGRHETVSNISLSQDRAGDENELVPADNVTTQKKGLGRPKKEKSDDPEKTAKEKEKAEKKAAKVEKERKEKEAQNKSRFLLSAFLAKPKPAVKVSNASPAKASSASAPSGQAASSSQSDYEKAFRPFVVKKDVTLAAANWFKDRTKTTDVIVLDDDTSCKDDSSGAGASSMNQSYEQWLDCIRNTPLSSANSLQRICPPYSRRRDGCYKSTPKYCVRDILSQLTEAEVSGNTTIVRKLTELLKSRKDIPVKVIIFHDDTRPGYFGTFTKSSTVVGPRCPIKKDAVAFDYGYDSGVEWEEEEEGGDDLMSLDGSGDEDDGSVESDLDDWLIDDDAADVDPGTPLSERATTPDLLPLPDIKRKSVNPEQKQTKKRKVVVPLVPFCKGPCWTTGVDNCDYQPFRPYCIQLFNDTPFPINPFTFVSTPIVEGRTPARNGFAVPAVPSRVFAPMAQTGVIASSHPNALAAGTSEQMVPKRKTIIPPPKTAFPDAYIPHLINKISTLATGNLTWIVDSIHQDLKEHKVKKNAIEAKVREMGEKCKLKKVWIVKGLAPSADSPTSLVAP